MDKNLFAIYYMNPRPEDNVPDGTEFLYASVPIEYDEGAAEGVVFLGISSTDEQRDIIITHDILTRSLLSKLGPLRYFPN